MRVPTYHVALHVPRPLLSTPNILAYVINTNLKFYLNMEYTLKESTIYKSLQTEKIPLTFYENLAFFVF